MKQTIRTTSIALALGALGLAGCSTDKTGTVEAAGGVKSIEYRSVVDLQHTIDPKIPLWRVQNSCANRQRWLLPAKFQHR
jgi:hypothetical protein